MDEYISTTYGDRVAEIYDEWYGDFEVEAIDTLAELAGGGRALELGIGTGRIALPLAARGIEVHGIEASEAMASKLRAKPGGASIEVTFGNFADVNVNKTFSLIFIVFNTLYALLTQEEQVRCFRNVAARLTDDGVFLLEGFVPDMTLFQKGQNVRATLVTPNRASIQASQHDPVRQRVKSQHIVFVNDQAKLFPVEIRYAWPSELDLMAQLAGLRLRHRWANWKREEFTSDSEKHISVYERSNVG